MQDDLFVIDTIPISFDLETMCKKYSSPDNYDGIMDTLKDVSIRVLNVARPKAVFKLSALDVLNDEQIKIKGVTFTSALLREKLEGRNRIFPYIATEGPELSEWNSSLDFFDQLFVNYFRQEIMTQCKNHAEETILKKYGIDQVSSMNPGSLAAWPLTQQKEFFELMDLAPEEIGVQLFPSMLMAPEFTVSGIFFQTTTKFHNCELCPRENCPNRKKPQNV